MAITSRPIGTAARWRQRAAQPLARPHTRPSRRGVLLPIVAYALALLAISVLVQTAVSTVQDTVNDWRYGTPRRVAVSAMVGHGELAGVPTYVEALNLGGQITIIEVPGGQPEQLRSIPGPYVLGDAQGRVVPHLALRDMNGDGHVDLRVTVREETVVYLNRDGAFTLLTLEERAQLTATPP